MSLDELMQAISQLASWLLPVAGVAVLVYLVLLLRTLTETLKDVSLTLLTAQAELKKLDGPLNTLDEISHTVDDVHAAVKKMAKEAADAAVKGADSVKAWFQEKKGPEGTVQDAEVTVHETAQDIADMADTKEE